MITTNSRDIIKVTVTYKDTLGTKWYVHCYNNNRVFTTNGNTGQWRQVEMTVPRFVKGNKMKYGADFVITVSRGKDLFVDMVEVENVSRLDGSLDLQAQIDQLRADLDSLMSQLIMIVAAIILILILLIIMIWRRRRHT
jgi:hypothetical protein